MLVAEYERVIGKIPELYSLLITPHKEKLDHSISPGLTTVKWMSINLQKFITSSYEAIAQFEQFLDTVNSIQEDRILASFKSMLKTPLVTVPQHDVITVSEFVQSAIQLCQAASVSLENKSVVVENAVNELINMLLPEDNTLPDAPPDDLSEPGSLAITRKVEQRMKLIQETNLLMEHYEQQNIETLLQLIRSTLESLKRRVAVASSLSFLDASMEDKHDQPLFVSNVVLSLPNLVTSPSLEEIQQAMNQVIQIVLSVAKTIYCWHQQRPTVAAPITIPESESLIHIRSRPKLTRQASNLRVKSYFPIVAEHKEIAKLIMSMGGTISSTKSIVKKTIQQFMKYEHLWSNDQDEYVGKFAENNPGVTEYQQEMHNLTLLEADILLQPDSLTAGAVCLNTEQLKMMLVTEAKQWRVTYGRTMSHYYQSLLEKIFESIEEWDKSLSRSLEDLDDVRSVMTTLKEVRDNEISIDMSLGPIEVCITNVMQYVLHNYRM